MVITKSGYKLSYSLEDTEYFESLVAIYKDILDELEKKKENDDEGK